MVGAGRFELPTSPTRKERSTMLSYAPTLLYNCTPSAREASRAYRILQPDCESIAYATHSTL